MCDRFKCTLNYFGNLAGRWSRTTDHTRHFPVIVLVVYCCAHGCTTRALALPDFSHIAQELTVYCCAYGWTVSAWAENISGFFHIRFTAAPPSETDTLTFLSTFYLLMSLALARQGIIFFGSAGDHFRRSFMCVDSTLPDSAKTNRENA